MQIPLYQALKSIKIANEQASAVVAALEEHIAMKISDATKGLEAQLRAQTWLLGFIGTMLAIIGLAPIVSKLL
jgi:hypothetical protein